MSSGDSFYDQIGGHETFDRLVRRFYEGIKDDPVLRPMYPDDDMNGAIWRLRSFLEQYWGGPQTYSEQRGHPRLRMRHQPVKVNPEARDRWLGHMKTAVDVARDRWLGHMKTAVDELGLAELDRQMLWDYLERAAFSMVNTFED